MAKRYMRLKEGRRIWEKAQGSMEQRSEALREAYEWVGLYYMGGRTWHREAFEDLVKDIVRIDLVPAHMR